jgi:hypothetical protein
MRLLVCALRPACRLLADLCRALGGHRLTVPAVLAPYVGGRVVPGDEDVRMPKVRAGVYVRAGSATTGAGSGGADAGRPLVTKSSDRTMAYPATEPNAATATLTSAIVLKPVMTAW